MSLSLPAPAEAETLLHDAVKLSPRPWETHLRNVALAAKSIANHLDELEPDAAYTLGLLHDIGRRAGKTGMRHTLDGYHHLKNLGFDDATRISLTHSFPLKNVHAIFGHWDVSEPELSFVESYIEEVTYDDYDRLIQLCDCLATSDSIVLIEKRMIDVALRYDVNELIVSKWKAYIAIQIFFKIS